MFQYVYTDILMCVYRMLTGHTRIHKAGSSTATITLRTLQGAWPPKPVQLTRQPVQQPTLKGRLSKTQYLRLLIFDSKVDIRLSSLTVFRLTVFVVLLYNFYFCTIRKLYSVKMNVS